GTLRLARHLHSRRAMKHLRSQSSTRRSPLPLSTTRLGQVAGGNSEWQWYWTGSTWAYGDPTGGGGGGGGGGGSYWGDGSGDAGGGDGGDGGDGGVGIGGAL
ncbi:MAG: hypothetical protein KA190_00410, partial [Kofleriaceae bacterium]|nr:hypothetical protein [Kofleriaceae bacterium]